MDFIAPVGFGLAVTSSLLAVWFWRRLSAVQEILAEQSRSYIEANSLVKERNDEIKKLNQKLDQVRETVRKEEKAKKEFEQKAQQAVLAADTLQTELDRAGERKDLRLEHLESQIRALTDQLSEADRERKQAFQQVEAFEKQHEKLATTAKKEAASAAEVLRNEAKNLRQENQKISKKLAKLEADTSIADPQVLKKLKKRSAYLEHLYSTMRGLREMAEERNQNWETALDHLSAWIIAQQGKKIADSATLGVRVGVALESIGHQLIADDFAAQNSPPESEPAPSLEEKSG